MNGHFQQGVDLAKEIVSTEGMTIDFPIDGMDAGEIEALLDGVLKTFDDHIRTLAGIRCSRKFLDLIASLNGFDRTNASYRGVKLVFDQSFWPSDKIELVTGWPMEKV